MFLTHVESKGKSHVAARGYRGQAKDCGWKRRATQDPQGLSKTELYLHAQTVSFSVNTEDALENRYAQKNPL